MNRWTKRFCSVVIWLDRIPRYGRVYHIRPLPERMFWCWQKSGLWGFYLLDRVGLLDRFLDELES